MAIQTGFLGAAALSFLLAAGAVAPSAADSPFLVEPDLEHAAIPPPVDLDPSTSLGQDEVGPMALPPSVTGPDPIAEAFAESLRHARVPVSPRASYPLVLN
ncbi:MAG: hypothetical protein ACREJG_09210, partial [Candidatus Rokuibacteriota bacterium]